MKSRIGMNKDYLITCVQCSGLYTVYLPLLLILNHLHLLCRGNSHNKNICPYMAIVFRPSWSVTVKSVIVLAWDITHTHELDMDNIMIDR